MSTKHGNKRHFQVLLDPARAELLERVASENEVRAAELIRSMVYASLRRIEPDDYAEAEPKDAATWRQSVQNRIEGRTQASAARSIKSKNVDVDRLVDRIFK